MTRMEVYCGGTTEQVQNKFIVVVSTKRMKPTALENTIDHMIGSVSLGFTFGESRRYVDWHVCPASWLSRRQSQEAHNGAIRKRSHDRLRKSIQAINRAIASSGEQCGDTCRLLIYRQDDLVRHYTLHSDHCARAIASRSARVPKSVPWVHGCKQVASTVAAMCSVRCLFTLDLAGNYNIAFQMYELVRTLWSFPRIFFWVGRAE